MSRFVHLHLHTEYSFADSIIRVPEKPDQADPANAKRANLLSRAVELDLPALAVTDLNNLFALIKFYKAAETVGIKPIAGADVMIAERDEKPWRLTVLCRDATGYLNLSHLLTRAWMEGHRPEGGVAALPEWLTEYNEGLLVLAGRDSRAGRLALEGRHDLAEQQLADWQNVFRDRLHLELTRTRREGEETFNRFALHAAGVRAIPVVASNDVRFLDAETFEAHEARVCIASGRVLDDPKRPRAYSPEQFLKSAEQMNECFADIPDALANTAALAERCNLELTLGEYALPAYPVPSDETLDSWVRRQAQDGLDQRLQKHPFASDATRDDYQRRLEQELDVIIRMGFPGYFLIVADFINWAKRHGIPVGPGRGSGAGSLVAWALGITDLDPLPYHLLFERFLNPERVSMPDFDIDFCMDRRDEVIDYVAGKYGRDRVSQIITYGTMSAKAVVRDCGRVLGHPYGFVDGIAKLIPHTLGITLSDALGRSAKAQDDASLSSPELMQRYEAEDDVRDLIDLALKLEDMTRNAGRHAGGVVIGPAPLYEFCPLFAEHDVDNLGRNPVTQFDKDDVEAIGLVKFDFLGLRTLTIIDWAVKAINARRQIQSEAPIDISAIPLDDRPTYRHIFIPGNTGAVFQFESRGMRELLKRAMPDRFDDLIALVSLYRPGPMDLIPDFIERKHGRQAVEYPDPRVEPVLRDTYGIMVYQEQVMQMAQIVGSYTLGGADLLRRAMGKKVPAEMAKHREIFRAGAGTNGVDERKADAIFDLMEKFAGYGFNKSHAAAYALVSYQTAWLKQHYPAEFMAATLSSDMDNTDKVVGFLDETHALGLTVQPPTVNDSQYMFEAIDPQTIRYGLGAIKGVGRGACEAIVLERARGGTFSDLLDFCQRVDSSKLNRRTLEALIQAGALDALGSNRASLALQLPEVLKATDQLAKERAAGQSSLFGGGDSPTETFELVLPETTEWPLAKRLQGEHDTLGHYLSGHPFDPYRDEIGALIGSHLGRLDQIWDSMAPQEKRGRRAEVNTVVAGQIVAVRRKGDSQMFVQLEDGQGRIECSVFTDAYAEYAALLTRDRIVVIQGGLREDEFSGGFSLRVRQCWDYAQLCADYAQRLSLSIDLRQADAWPQIEAILAEHRGATPMRVHLSRPGVTGALDLDRRHSVKVTPSLLERLRAQSGVRAVRLSIAKPWA